MPSSRFTKSALVVLAILVCMVTGLSQQPAPAQAEKKPAEQADKKPAEKDPKAQTDKPGAKLPYTLKVKTRPILNITLKAEKANAADVTQELSKKINAPIFLGTERQKDPLSIEFSELTLEPALQLLSPTVYVDYEIDAGSQEPPKVLGIFLYDANQGEPPLTAVVHGSTQSILIEGNTEDGVVTEGDDKEKKEEPLVVTYENHALSVKAKKQPLSLIMLKIGETLGIPVDIQDERMEVVDANISKLPIEDALRQLAPNIKMFLRADLTRSERRALRLVLTQPPRQTQ